MEKVIRFYSGWAKNSIPLLYYDDFVFDEDTTCLELCTFNYEEEPITISCTQDKMSGKMVRKIEKGWREPDSDREYHFVVDTWWYGLNSEPLYDIELTEQMKSEANLPTSIYEAMKKDNVKTVGLWEMWGDCTTVKQDIEELREQGFSNIYFYVKYGNDDPVGEYANLCEEGSRVIVGPKIGLKPKTKTREKIIRFYSPWCRGSFRRLAKEDIVFDDGVTSIEICTSSYDYDGLSTISYSPDDSGKGTVKKVEDGWKELDPEKDYYFVAEAWWYDSASKPWDDIELTEQMRCSPLPVALFEAMQSDNVITVGLWDQWGDGETLGHAIEELKDKGFKKVYELSKYVNDDPVGEYVEQQEDFKGSVQCPKIRLKNKSKTRAPKPKSQPKPKKKVSGVVTGDTSLLYGNILSLIRSSYEGCNIDLSVVEGDLRILVKGYKGQKSSQKK